MVATITCWLSTRVPSRSNTMSFGSGRMASGLTAPARSVQCLRASRDRDKPSGMELFDRSGAVRRPPLRLLARNLADFFLPPDRAAAARALGAAPRGDGHPVLVLPAFLKGDGATLYLRSFLARLGYEPHGWHQGVNTGPTDAALEGSKRRLLELRRRHGRKV